MPKIRIYIEPKDINNFIEVKDLNIVIRSRMFYVLGKKIYYISLMVRVRNICLR